MSTGYPINDKAGSYFLTFQVVDWVDMYWILCFERKLKIWHQTAVGAAYA